MRARALPGLLVCLIVFSVGSVLAGSGVANSNQITNCTNPGAKLPVILVHGFSSDISTFSSLYPGLVEAIQSDGQTSVQLFDYSDSNREWVVPDTSTELADRVRCVASLSVQMGGPGKVLLIGHSMGGLVVRGALQDASLAPLVAAVITIGTPHEGVIPVLTVASIQPGAADWLRNKMLGRVWKIICPDEEFECGLGRDLVSEARAALVVGSPQLTALGGIPSSVPFYAIAGEINFEVWLLSKRAVSWLGDGLVSTASALAGSAPSKRLVVSCGLIDVVDFINVALTTLKPGKGIEPSCSHGRLLEHPDTITFIEGIIATFAGQTVPTNPPTTVSPTTPTTVAQPVPGTDPLEVAHRFVAAWNNNDRAAAAELWLSDPLVPDYLGGVVPFDDVWPVGLEPGGFGPAPYPPLDDTNGCNSNEGFNDLVNCQFDFDWNYFGAAYLYLLLAKGVDGLWGVIDMEIEGGD